jgi:glycosyltransferase involved in cell wall biosynthesis
MAHEAEPGFYTPFKDSRTRTAIHEMARYADRIYALNPDLLHVLPSRACFLPYANVDLDSWIPVHSSPAKVPVVVHAPSIRSIKGTGHILKAVNRLKSEGVAFEFKLVEGKSNEEARRIYERADLLIDQLLAGWYGGLSVEFMALGKPSMCYVRSEDLRFLPSRMASDIPIIQVSPSTLYDTLKEWLTERRHELPEVGRRSRAFVEKWHDPKKIAQLMRQEYESLYNRKRR